MSEVEKMYENAGVNKETECNEPSDVCSENGECDICFYANNYNSYANLAQAVLVSLVSLVA